VTCDIDRRFSLPASSASLVASSSLSTGVPECLARAGLAGKRCIASILTDDCVRHVRALNLKSRINYLFRCTVIATTCLLVDRGGDIGRAGPRESIVIFTAIWTYKLAYPAIEVGFSRFPHDASSRCDGAHFQCCADYSVCDPTVGSNVLAGLVPAPLATTLLESIRKAVELPATGSSGAEHFDGFFTKHEFMPAAEFGGRGQEMAGARTRLQEQAKFFRKIAQC